MGKITLLILLAVLFACAGGPAYADPVTAAVVAGIAAGGGSAIAGATIFGLSVAGSAIAVGLTTTALTYYSTKQAAKAAEKASYEASLRDIEGRATDLHHGPSTPTRSSMANTAWEVPSSTPP